MAIGTGSWVAPRLSGRLFGLDAVANPQLPYIGRLFGVRDVDAVLRTVTEATLAMFGPKVLEKGIADPTMPHVTGDVVAWLATQPEAKEFAGKLISSPTFFKERGIQFPSS